MNLTTHFLYNISNTALYQPQIVHVLIGIVLGIILLFALRFVLLYHIGFFVVWNEKRALESKKNVLTDLILMKDIQSEMEKDIEKASLKATFQG